MSRHGENIRKRKDGRWEGRYSKGKINGKPVQGSVFASTYKEAKEKLLLARFQAVTQQESPSYKGTSFEETFGVIAEEWFAEGRVSLKPSTISRYRSILDTYLIPEFGTVKIEGISRADVNTFYTRLLSESGCHKKPLSPKTVLCILSVFRIVLKYARLEKGLNVVNTEDISIKQEQKVLRVFSMDEYRIISNKLISSHSMDCLGILLSLYTGLRIGEVCALRWGDISFDEQVIHITKTMQRIQLPKGYKPRTKIVITSPKSKCSVRDIPIPGEVVRLLITMRKPDDCYLLTGKRNEYMEPRTMENHFNKLMMDCNIKGATMHTCRHSFATRCVELDFDVKTLSEILGHASVSITMNRYVHPSMALKHKHMDKLSRFLEGQE